jgi:PEP-CTERM motif
MNGSRSVRLHMNHLRINYGFAQIRLAILLLSACPAAAQSCPTLPAPLAFETATGTAYEQGYGYYNIVQQNTSPGAASESNAFGSATGTGSLGSNPTATAAASGTNSSGGATVIYFMEACGTDLTATLLSGGSVSASSETQTAPPDSTLSASAGGQANVLIGIASTVPGQLYNTLTSTIVEIDISSYNGASASAGGTVLPALVTVPANTLVAVYTLASAGAQYGGASATADPTFELDPLAATSKDFTLVFSPGVTSSAPLSGPTIPEPSTWAMMIVGFAGLGYLGWRRGRARPAAA